MRFTSVILFCITLCASSFCDKIMGDVLFHEDSMYVVTVPDSVIIPPLLSGGDTIVIRYDSLLNAHGVSTEEIANHINIISNLRTFALQCITGLDESINHCKDTQNGKIPFRFTLNGNLFNYFGGASKGPDLETYKLERSGEARFFMPHDPCVPCNKIEPEDAKEVIEQQALRFLRQLLALYDLSHEFEQYSVKEIKEYYNASTSIIVVHITPKEETDVDDLRDLSLTFSKEFGHLRSYTGRITNDYSLDYVPKISKKEVLGILNKLIEKSGKEYKVTRLKISKRGEWFWRAYLHKKNSESGFAKLVQINCETGDVFSHGL